MNRYFIKYMLYDWKEVDEETYYNYKNNLDDKSIIYIEPLGNECIESWKNGFLHKGSIIFEEK